MGSKLIINLYEEIDIIAKEKRVLEKRLEKMPYIEFEDKEITIKRQEINSKLFWLGSLSGKIKNDIIGYTELAERINSIKI